jgi:hypothetical protein
VCCLHVCTVQSVNSDLPSWQHGSERDTELYITPCITVTNAVVSA